MASETEICNLALVRLGHSTISSLDEGSPASEWCTLFYSHCRDELLRIHPWNFAIKRVTLAQDVTTPNHEFTYRHALPSDCLKVIRTNWEASGGQSAGIVYGFPGIMGYSNELIPYRIEGRYLLCNEDTVKIEYVAKITDPAQFDPLFVDVLAQRMAAEMAMKLTDNATLYKTAWDVYNMKLTDARLQDAMEGTPRDVVDNSGWLLARS